MNSKKDFSTQNQQDCWTILYESLADTILKRRGKDGEVVVRHANRLCGFTAGNILREHMIHKNQHTNLKTLFHLLCTAQMDPRFRIEWQILNEEEAVFDVITCPICDFLTEREKGDLLLPFCEEFHSGYLSGFTQEAGQCCLSEHFSYPGENSCRFGCYFRAANISKEQLSSCFTDTRQEKAAFPSPKHNIKASCQFFSFLAGLLVHSYVSEGKKRYGDDSLFLTAEGLKRAAMETSDFLKERAHAAGKKPDAAFLFDNSFWYSEEPLSEYEERLKELISLNYCCILKKNFI